MWIERGKVLSCWRNVGSDGEALIVGGRSCHALAAAAKSSYRSVDPQTLHGNVPQVDPVPNGPTNSAAITTMFPLRVCGGKLLVAVTRERRYGPSRLRVNDDDDRSRRESRGRRVSFARLMEMERPYSDAMRAASKVKPT